MKIKITKLSASEAPLYPTPEKEKYIPGQFNGLVSLPIEYSIEGTLCYPIKVGERVIVNRTKRNNINCDGIFGSSKVVSFDEKTFTTTNSIYKYEYID